MTISIGKKICIIGLSSSGKSTLADIIAKKRNLNLLHLDQIGHIPNTNWVPAPAEEWMPRHDKFIEQDNWVVDGCYFRTMTQRLAKADTVIFIKMSRFGCAYRFVKRALQKKKDRFGKLEGATDDCNLAMLKYILLEAPRKFSKYEKLIKENPHLKVIYLYSFDDINKLVENL
ncbi:MAG: hypothetical protein LBR70_01545 [Lactobacillaceae bacterium]|jgi:adenylate kinase family enzyme|nr:hypothetical protein [Lactobacillaceae bacterium]